ncbi:hypothetical protein H6P81_012670 [Aristolochia fimbriata]|uniref:Uncharacterized protein n=1 Tax=Aristolochia fimbriata TaxID=158543 RepID=A0AAV7ECH6_ARIFI|nr:hypothetical protein H6P81_012670 [Aristolochia fimbriata]
MGESHGFQLGHHEQAKKVAAHGKPREAAHEGKLVMEVSAGKGHAADKYYEDVDSSASEFLRKKHEFFLRESLLSMQGTLNLSHISSQPQLHGFGKLTSRLYKTADMAARSRKCFYYT